MSRIIKIIPRELKEYTTIHEECGAEIGYTKDDILEDGLRRFIDGSEEMTYCIICPNCGKKVYVDQIK